MVKTKGGKKFPVVIPTNCSKIKTRKIDRYRIEVSLICDLKCEYCVVHLNKVFQRDQMMDKNTAVRIMERFCEEVGEEGSLLLIGGEPLLNWSVVKLMIELCPAKTMIFTNAFSLDEEKIDFLSRHHTLVLTSLDGYSNEHNVKRFQTNVEKKSGIVKKNIKKMVKAGCNLGIGCMVHDGNVRELTEVAEFFFNDLGVRSISFSYPHLTLEKVDISEFDMKVYTEQIKKMLVYSKNKKVYIDQIGRVTRSILRSEPILSSCKAGVSQRTFYPDGTETICTKLDLLPGYQFDNYLNSLPSKNKNCVSCLAQNICGGGCWWDAALNPNRKGVDSRICSYNKALVSHIVKDIVKELHNITTQEEAVSLVEEKYGPTMFPIWT